MSSRKQMQYLPPELWSEVLARLPVKSLLKFRCVCKSWRSVIDSPNFVSVHFNSFKNNRESNHVLFLEGYIWRCRRWMLRRSDDTFSKINELFAPFEFTFASVGGSVNGLVLIYGNNEGEIILWNPSIRQSMLLPTAPILRWGHMEPGLGFDQLTNDFKVLALMYCRCVNPRLSKVFVLVYSLRVGRWKYMTGGGTPYLRCSGQQAFVKGAIHWLGYDMRAADHKKKEYKILSFDVGRENFEYMKLPVDREGDSGLKERTLTVLDQSLAVVDTFSCRCNIWVMEKYGVAHSWTKRYKIDLELSRFIFVGKNGKLLFTRKRQGVKAYDIKSKRVMDRAEAHFQCVTFVDTYMESLVRLKGVGGRHVKTLSSKQKEEPTDKEW